MVNNISKQKFFSIRFKKVKSIPSIGREIVKASSKEIARRKFKRTSVFRRQKITGITKIDF